LKHSKSYLVICKVWFREEMTTLLLDGVKYKLWTPQRENELEKIVKEHVKDIFGEDSIYFEKRKISSELGIRSIPDGFTIDFRSEKLYAIEVELSTHNYDHIVSQGSRHIDAIDNLDTKHKLVKVFYNEIKSDPHKKLFVKGFIEEDLHDFLTSISENPELVIIVDGISNDVKQAQRALDPRMRTKIIEFKTFERENVSGLGVHAHLFEPIIKSEIEIKRPFEVEHRAIAKGRKTPQKEYRIPILETLIEMGGRGRVKDVLEKVEGKMKGRLTKADYESVPSGEERQWRNLARWERKNMVRKRLLKDNSPRGIWEITDKGRNYYSSAKNR